MNQIKNKVINIEFRGNHYTLERLDDRKYYELWKNSLAIADDYGFYLHFYLDLERQGGENLNLAQIYVALEKLCGESGKSFDDWKGSFSFPFFLKVSKGGQNFDYLLKIYDHRGSVYFGIHKQLQPDHSYDTRVVHQPFPEEFSRQEINEFICYFYGYLQGYFEEIKSSYSQFFYKVVDSNCIIFGYKNGNFFEEHYDGEEEYQEAVQLLTQVVSD